FLQYKFTDIESLLVIILKSPSYICLPIRQILIQLNINRHKLNAKKERSEATQIFCSHLIWCNQN
ncbi:hypothetical protein, partial [Arsenophonus endosymbiont of Bemisia tabaci]